MQDFILKRAKRGAITMHLLPSGELEVKAPYLIPEFVIKQFVMSHNDWIEKQKAKISARAKQVAREYKEGEKYAFLGREYILEFGNYSQIEIERDKLLFPVGLKFRVKKEIEAWYIKEAKKLITKQLTYYADLLKVNYLEMYVSDTSSKWGSCSSDNRLQFNWRLVMAPLMVLNYVIVHELSHTVHKNHSRSFWNLVRSVNPSYRQQVKWLKDNGHLLVV